MDLESGQTTKRVMFAHDNPCQLAEKGEKEPKSFKTQQKDARKTQQMGLKKKSVVVSENTTLDTREPRGRERNQKKRGFGRLSCGASVDTSDCIKRKLNSKFTDKKMEKSSNENPDFQENCQISDPDTIWGYVLNHEKAASPKPTSIDFTVIEEPLVIEQRETRFQEPS